MLRRNRAVAPANQSLAPQRTSAARQPIQAIPIIAVKGAISSEIFRKFSARRSLFPDEHKVLICRLQAMACFRAAIIAKPGAALGKWAYWTKVQ
jgi:hypothetical protein